MRRHFPAGWVLAAGLWAVPAFGQEAAAGPDVALAPVVVDGEVLFSVRGVTAFPAAQRAAGIAERIRELAADTQVAASSLTVTDQARETTIVAGERPVLRVQDEDAALEGVDRRILAEVYSKRIAAAIEAYRAARDPARLWRHGLIALLATVVLLAAVFVCVRAVRWVGARLERRIHVRDVQIQSVRLFRAEQLWWGVRGVLRFMAGLAIVAMVVVYARYVLGLFPWTRGAAVQLVALTLAPLRTLGTGLLDAIPNVLFLVVLFLLTRYVLTLVRLFCEGVGSGAVTVQGFERDWAEPTYRLLRLAIVAFAIIVAYPYVPGSDTDAFKGITVFVGILFSLGSSSLVGNVIAGYAMTYRRTFRLGDRVKVGSHLGDVVEVRLLGTHLRTPRNEVVVVPNATIVGAEVVNYSALARETGVILSATVGIGYETPWRQVEAMLLEAAARTPGLLRDRRPFVHQTALGDFAVTYTINVHTDTPERMLALSSDLHRNILDVFNEYGVQIMTPAYEGDPEVPKLVPKDQWFMAPATPPAPSGPRSPPETPAPTS